MQHVPKTTQSSAPLALRLPPALGSPDPVLAYAAMAHNDVSNPLSSVLVGLQSSLSEQKRVQQDQTDSLREEIRKLSINNSPTSSGGGHCRRSNNDDKGKTRRNYRDLSNNPNWQATLASEYDNRPRKDTDICYFHYGFGDGMRNYLQ